MQVLELAKKYLSTVQVKQLVSLAPLHVVQVT